MSRLDRWREERRKIPCEERYGGVSSREMGGGLGFWHDSCARQRSSMPIWGLAVVQWAVEICLNAEDGYERAVSRGCQEPCPSRKGLEAAWQLTWKQRRLESL